tara:strand:- start:457 stop:801 length:345 start_codon:yes stop_codon:yes gene_type:complete
MEQSKVIIYVRFNTDIDQEYVDNTKKELYKFIDMIGANLVNEYWEILDKNTESGIIDYIIDECMRKDCSILTYDLNSLHGYISGAFYILGEAFKDQVSIFFVDPDSSLKSILHV